VETTSCLARWNSRDTLMSSTAWLRAYFDVGNVVAFAWPEQWIRILGKRIVRVHLKDFKKGPRSWVNLREGDVNWPAVVRHSKTSATPAM